MSQFPGQRLPVLHQVQGVADFNLEFINQLYQPRPGLMKGFANQAEERKMKVVCAFVGAVGFVVWSSAASAEVVEGSGQAVSGDALRVGAEVFYLNGTVAPAGEKRSQDRLSDLLSGHTVICNVQKMTQGSLRTATCSSAGADISSQMVRSGMAFAYAENGVDLIALQSAARQEGLGLWGSDEAEALAGGVASGSAPPRDCTIKGNKSHQAPYDLRYHMPDTTYYSRTRINPGQGEKWFCTKVDAQAAGFGSSER